MQLYQCPGPLVGQMQLGVGRNAGGICHSITPGDRLVLFVDRQVFLQVIHRSRGFYHVRVLCSSVLVEL